MMIILIKINKEVNTNIYIIKCFNLIGSKRRYLQVDSWKSALYDVIKRTNTSLSNLSLLPNSGRSLCFYGII